MNNLTVLVEKVNNILVTTSNRVAEELGVNHRDLLEKIRGYIDKFTKAETSALVEEFYIPSTYKVKDNFKTYDNYLITEKGVAQLIGGYSGAVPRAFELNVAYINKFEEMKNHIKNQYQVPSTFAEALRLAANLQEENEKLMLENKEAKPKVIFADSVSASKTSILIGDLAKLLKQNGIDIGAKRLFSWLRENRYLVKRNGTDYNMPTQKSMELGLFEVKETTVTHADGHITVNRTPKVTGKGQVYFVNKFIKNKSA